MSLSSLAFRSVVSSLLTFLHTVHTPHQCVDQMHLCVLCSKYCLRMDPWTWGSQGRWLGSGTDAQRKRVRTGLNVRTQLEPRSVVFTSSLDEVVFCKAHFNTELRIIWPKELKSPEGGIRSGQSFSWCYLKSQRATKGGRAALAHLASKFWPFSEFHTLSRD